MLPLQLAASDASPEVVRLLLRYGGPEPAEPDPATSDGITPLWIADRTGARRELLIACGADVESSRPMGLRPAHPRRSRATARCWCCSSQRERTRTA